MSNVDLATEMTNMITAERGYQANSRVITTADEMLATLVYDALGATRTTSGQVSRHDSKGGTAGRGHAPRSLGVGRRRRRPTPWLS